MSGSIPASSLTSLISGVSDMKVEYVGLGFGNALAMVISFHENNHIGWAILHGIFSWFYVLYAYFFVR
jgi:hypothetical protein